MNLESGLHDELYELLPIGASEGRKALLLSKKRVLIGRSQTCDIKIPHNEVTAIHAVLEAHGGKFKVFDMNSTNGTYVNGERIVSKTCQLGDKLQFGPLEFKLQKYQEDDVAPPPLDMLRPGAVPQQMKQAGKVSLPSKTSVEEEKAHDQEPPSSPPGLPEKSTPNEELPEVVYPLASDPRAEFSDYIFEDADTIYPIFRYAVQETAVEIIILFKDRIHSVDYLSSKDGVYKLVGRTPSTKEIEYAYLGEKDKVDFVEVKGGEAFVTPLPGYEILSLSDQRSPTGTIHLNNDDIVRFKKGDLQIFVRSTQAPPHVKPAPILRRDGDLKKYLFLMFFLCIGFLSAMTMFQVDEEIEDEKIPDRLATILYQKKPVVSKKPPIDKTKDAPKEVVQKSPEQKVEPKPEKKQPAKEKQDDQKAVVKAGSESAKKDAPAKKATPNKAQKENKQDTVRAKKQNQNSEKPSAPSASEAQAPAKSAAKGNVDTYQSTNFKSTVSSVLSRGGATRKTKASTASSVAGSGSISGGESATIRRAETQNNVGSLSGSAQGKLDESRGVEGLVSQRELYTAGLPYKEVVLGGMDPDTIRRILVEHIPQFRYCYQKELDRASQKFDGVVRLDFIIGASGNVTRAGIEAASDSLPVSVKRCVVNVLKGIKFPAPRGGGVVEVNQPFNFYPRR